MKNSLFGSAKQKAQMKRNILLTIEYDGTNFSGWQRQPGKRTVQGELERVLTELCACEIKIDGTSRTDAGVHAKGQRATFCGDFGIPTENLANAANHLLAGDRNSVSDVRITKAEEVPEGFHARFDAKGKQYIYSIDFKESAFRRNFAYVVESKLNSEEMAKAGHAIEGTHDFAAFQAAGGNERETTVRTVSEVKITEVTNGLIPGLEISVKGDGFLYNMVRIIAGTLVDVGRGKISADDIPEILNSLDRSRAGHTAPAQGLCLNEVYYDNGFKGKESIQKQLDDLMEDYFASFL